LEPCLWEDNGLGKRVKDQRERRIVGRAEGFYMGKERDEAGLVLAVYWRLCNAKDSFSCIPIFKGWGGIVAWRGEGDDDGKGIGVVNEVDESISNVVVEGDYDVESKMADGCTANTDRTTTQDEV